MQTWYYSHLGERQGPVAFDELQALAHRGELDAQKDLVWTEGMADWTPSGTVPGLFASAPPADDFNPYAAPSTAPGDLLAPSDSSGALPEIAPGSQPLAVLDCLKRAMALTWRHFGLIIGIGAIYWIASIALSFGATFLAGSTPGIASSSEEMTPLQAVLQLISVVFSIFLNLGLIRVSLHLISGQEARVGQLFGEGDKLLRSLGASLLYYLMVGLGLMLFIVPGIYVALRFGLFQYAIVDRNLGILESFRYSSALTANNRLNLLGLGVLMALIILAGILPLLLGLFFAVPVVTLALPIAYRFLQFGPGALQDQPGTTVPLLRGNTPPSAP